MKELGLTQQQFADAIGAHRVTVADWVRGASKPTGLYLRALMELAEKAKRKAKR
jgi:DNA-binding transcriptional regulator YiaG